MNHYNKWGHYDRSCLHRVRDLDGVEIMRRLILQRNPFIQHLGSMIWQEWISSLYLLKLRFIRSDSNSLKSCKSINGPLEGLDCYFVICYLAFWLGCPRIVDEELQTQAWKLLKVQVLNWDTLTEFSRQGHELKQEDMHFRMFWMWLDLWIFRANRQTHQGLSLNSSTRVVYSFILNCEWSNEDLSKWKFMIEEFKEQSFMFADAE